MSIAAWILGALLAPLAGAPVQEVEERARPNVVLVLVDDLGPGDLSRSGNPDVATPHLDRLAAESVELTRFYVSPLCGPSRAALFSGTWPARTGVFRNGWPMRPGTRTLAERLGDGGYATGLFGKWHLGDYAPYRASDQGFGTTLVTRGGVIGQLAPTPNLVRYTDPTFLWNGELRSFEGEATDVTFDVALEWIAGRAEAREPFLAVLSTNAPHGPYTDVPEEEYARKRLALDVDGAATEEERAERDELARVYALVERLDRGVGRLLSGLEELGIADETLLVFLSDNGPSTLRYDTGLRGSKGGTAEGAVRVPCFVRWPGRLGAGQRVDGVAAHVDLVPTVLEACGLEPAPAEELDGRSLLSLLRGEAQPDPERLVFLEAHRGREQGPLDNFCVVSQRWKLMRAGFFEREGDGAKEAVEGEEESGLEGLRLYDLEADPAEEVDLAEEHPETVARLLAAYRALVDELGPDPAGSAPRIRLGPQEKELLLTHDRRRWVVGEGVSSPWRLRVERGGTFDVEVTFPPAQERRRVLLSAGTTSEGVTVPPGKSRARLPNVRLGRGTVGLEVLIDYQPVWQVRLTRR